ncbi:hypothetical protein F9C11_20885 [Amycolatopsis sp. VS8301801F10]|uniref:hypothetical protein n=1 Tax=Amycolatopsis sp. VS8301801F10 TaxID=2652442 RepID=UPI0038FCF951
MLKTYILPHSSRTFRIMAASLLAAGVCFATAAAQATPVRATHDASASAPLPALARSDHREATFATFTECVAAGNDGHARGIWGDWYCDMPPHSEVIELWVDDVCSRCFLPGSAETWDPALA